MDTQLIIGLLLIGIPFAAIWLSMRKMFAAEKAKSRTPFTEKLLRPAGESLRMKIDEIRDQIMNVGMLMCGMIIVPGLMAMQATMQSLSGKLIAWLSVPAVFWAIAVLQWRKMAKLRNALRNYELGYDGERYVASELDQIRARGFRIYHDFVFDMKPGGDDTTFNIDHIAIGPPGIFAIETKARRKPRTGNESEQDNHVVFYDGEAIKFPSGYRDQDSIQQALRASEDLSDFLTGSSDQIVPVMPVVVLPGWKVERKVNGTVKVLCGAELASGIAELKPHKTLSAERLRVAADKIEAHCRNLDTA